MKFEPCCELPLPKNVFFPRNQNRVDQGGPAAGLPESVIPQIPDQESDFAAADDGDVVVGDRLCFAVEPGGREVPEDVDGFAVDGKAFGAVLSPEIPWLELDFAGVCVAVSAAAFDGDGEAVEEEILAPCDGDQAALVGQFGAVNRHEDVLA